MFIVITVKDLTYYYFILVLMGRDGTAITSLRLTINDPLAQNFSYEVSYYNYYIQSVLLNP